MKLHLIIKIISTEVNMTDEWHKVPAPVLVATIIVSRVFVVISAVEFTGQTSIEYRVAKTIISQ